MGVREPSCSRIKISFMPGRGITQGNALFCEAAVHFVFHPINDDHTVGGNAALQFQKGSPFQSAVCPDGVSFPALKRTCPAAIFPLGMSTG